MRAVHRLVCLLLSLAAAGLAPMTSVRASAQTAAAAQAAPIRTDEAARRRFAPAANHAAKLLQVQAIIGRMAVSSEVVPGDARALALVMTAARGRTIADSALNAFTMRLALAVAEGSFDEDSVERLAQDLFAAVNSRSLTAREASLLVTDVETLLRESGAGRESVAAAVAALVAIGPSTAAPAAGTSAPITPGAPRSEGDNPPARSLAVLTRK